MSKTNRDSASTSDTAGSVLNGTEPASFETALAELETMVTNMEAGELTLEQALAAYKRGAALLQYCQSALKEAQQQVKVLEAGMLNDLPDADDNG